MSKAEGKIRFFTIIQNMIKENIKTLIYIILVIVIIFAGFQIYFFNKNRQMLELSIKYFDLKASDSQSEFIEEMNLIAKDKSFYGLLASIELINHKIATKKYNESYDDYINVLEKKNIDNIYKTLIAIQASYNLLNKIESEKLLNLLSYVDKSFDSFFGYHLEIVYLLSISQNNIKKAKNVYDQIMENEKIPSSIKERVNKINEFEKYK